MEEEEEVEEEEEEEEGEGKGEVVGGAGRTHTAGETNSTTIHRENDFYTEIGKFMLL